MAPPPTTTTPRPPPQSVPPTPSKSLTPHPSRRLNFTGPKSGPSPAPTMPAKDASFPTEHPVEVISRIRDQPEHRKDSAAAMAAMEVAEGGKSLRLRTDFGFRDFGLDGVWVAEGDDLEEFYRRYVRSRIEGVRLGGKCTVMMYGPTGSGKSHTMFGSGKQPGIVYLALKDILEGGAEEKGEGDAAGFGVGFFVQVAVLEIYNEEVYDLMTPAANAGGSSGGGNAGATKGNAPKVRLEVMGKKVKNATYICGNEAGKISREVAKVEKRRIVKSTNCNDRSSRSHCMIILDVPAVGGRLMLVDMAGSENIEAAGQTGFEAKMQTGKINQGNIALKRVVESIANGDSHVPFRDSKLTMLLQDSFEDDKSKILMILCASPDPKELHKTIMTLEYGAKAKCIMRAAHVSMPRDKANLEDSALLNSRIMAMNQFIFKLQADNKAKEKERDQAQRMLRQKDEELAQLKARLNAVEGHATAVREAQINQVVMERTQVLQQELAHMADRMLRQQQELEAVKRQLNDAAAVLPEMEGGGRLMARFGEVAASAGDHQAMVMSMELDNGDQPSISDVKEIKEDTRPVSLWNQQPMLLTNADSNVGFSVVDEKDKLTLSTVFEEDEEGEDCDLVHCKEVVEDSEVDRKTRIMNIFRLCGDHREQHRTTACLFSPVDDADGHKENGVPTPLKDAGACLHHDDVKKGAATTEHCGGFMLPFSPLENKLKGVTVSPHVSHISPRCAAT